MWKVCLLLPCFVIFNHVRFLIDSQNTILVIWPLKNVYLNRLIQTIFRLYVESVWYPGRQLNVMNLVNSIPLRGSNSSASNPTGAESYSNNMFEDKKMFQDIVEPPKFITGDFLYSLWHPSNFHFDFVTLLFALRFINIHIIN